MIDKFYISKNLKQMFLNLYYFKINHIANIIFKFQHFVLNKLNF